MISTENKKLGAGLVAAVRRGPKISWQPLFWKNCGFHRNFWCNHQVYLLLKGFWYNKDCVRQSSGRTFKFSSSQKDHFSIYEVGVVHFEFEKLDKTVKKFLFNGYFIELSEYSYYVYQYCSPRWRFKKSFGIYFFYRLTNVNVKWILNWCCV